MLLRNILLITIIFANKSLGANSPTFSSAELGIRGFKMPKDSQQKSIKIKLDLDTKGAISPYIYGYGAVSGDSDLWDPNNRFTLFRLGGNRFTAYNWENNVSHAGSDWRYQNDLYLCSNISPIVTQNDCKLPGGVVKGFAEHAFGLNKSKQNASILVTIPIIGHVAYQTTDGDVCPQEHVEKTMECSTRSYLKSKFRISRSKGTDKFDGRPNISDEYVNQNEFVSWLVSTFPKSKRDGKEIFFSMDNEPALWGMTHNRVRPGGDYCKHNPSYSEIFSRNLEYALMVKEVSPNSLVFGPVDYGWYSMKHFQGFDQCDENKGQIFHEFFLKSLQKAAKKSPGGKSPVDILDIHWYSEIQPKEGTKIIEKHAPTHETYIKARLDAPRSLWDPDFVEDSWIAQKDLGKQPIRLIPRLRELIQKHNPGMGISISEYTYGGENHISGALAQMDVLGIFGREGLFAATFWPLSEKSNYIYGAFRMFRNFDGKGGYFGDTAYLATSSSSSRLSVYASNDPQKPSGIIAIVINKTSQEQTLEWEISGSKVALKEAIIYKLDETATIPKFFRKVPFSEINKVSISPLTAYTIVMRGLN